MGFYYYIVMTMVPFSVIFTALLLLPIPQKIRAVFIKCVDSIFLLPGPLGMTLISFLLVILGIVFANVSYKLYQINAAYDHEAVNQEPPKITMSHFKLVKAQRDFWVGLALFSFWALLTRLLYVFKNPSDNGAAVGDAAAATSKQVPPKVPPPPPSTTTPAADKPPAYKKKD